MTEQQDTTETVQILDELGRGNREALDRLLSTHRAYVRRIVELRMGSDLRDRVDPSDVVQETHIIVARRIDEFLDRRPTSFRVWLRRKALDQIVDTRRHHLAAKRSMHREYHLSDASSLSIAQHLAKGQPSRIASRKETAEKVRSQITQMSQIDQEILLLRHIEELTNAEAAEVLEIDPATARKRHGRAIIRLADSLSDSDLSFDR